MPMLFEFLPIVLFFIAYKLGNIYTATAVLMVSCLAQAGYQWITQKKIEKNTLVVLISVLVLGGATLAFHDQRFIMWKPSIVFGLFALVLIINQITQKKPIMQSLLEKNLSLPEPLWRKINLTWSCFFSAMALLNLYIINYYDIDTWVNFKLFGILGITVLFSIGQAIYISKQAGIANENS
jgi:intracellular septation protein